MQVKVGIVHPFCLQTSFFFFFFLAVPRGIQFLGQGWSPRHSSDPSHCSDNVGSLTHCAARELQDVTHFNISALKTMYST